MRETTHRSGVSAGAGDAPALEARGVTVRFGGLLALSDVDFAAAPGSITGLVGPNGAGKTTLFGVLSGLLRPSKGEVVMHGERITTASPQNRARRGLARTFQRIELFNELTVAEHLRLAYRARRAAHREWADLLGLTAIMKDPEEDAVVQELLDSLGLTPIAGQIAGSLPLGTGRLVEVGRALATRPSVLLLDEPSSGLDTRETDELAEVLMRTQREHGITLVLVEHNLDLVLRLSDRVYVLDFGRMIANGTPDEVRANPEVQAAYIGTAAQGDKASASGGRDPAARVAGSPSPSAGPKGEEPLLRIEDLQVNYGAARALFGLSLDVRPGSALALLGANGSGKSTVARALSGLISPTKGRIIFDGADITKRTPHQIARLGLAHVPEGRGIFPGLSVLDNLRMGLRFACDGADRKAALDRAFEMFPVLGERRRQLAGTLSGGEQQMLALARVLAAPPRLLVADEMSLGLAPMLIDMIFESLQKARAAGVTVILIEQFADRALAFADEAAILRHGELTWHGPASAASGEVLAHYLGESAGTAAVE